MDRELLVSGCAALLCSSVGAAAQDGGELGPLSGAALYQACIEYMQSPASENGRVCGIYVRGFIAGSDRIVLMSSQHTPARSESFTDRALRTRLGKRVTVQPEYCIAADVTLRMLVEQLLSQATITAPDETTEAAELLYATLGRFHRC